MKTRWKVLVGVAVAAVPAYLYLVQANTAPADCQFALDIPRLRQLAATVPGERPQEVRVEHLATFHMPGAVVVTGAPWGMTRMPVYAYQVVFSNRTILIDTAMSPDDAKKLHADEIDEAAWTRLTQAMSSTSAIYVTHEHADHLGGLVANLAAPNVMAVARLTREQLDHPDRLKPLELPAGARDKIKTLSYEGAVAVAPGVVLIKAPGHTPGSQLVYIQLVDGKEILLMGDTAWHRQNIDEVRGPPHVTSLMLHNDRAANVCQLAAARDAEAKNPGLHVVPGHDGDVMSALFADGVLKDGFQQ